MKSQYKNTIYKRHTAWNDMDEQVLVAMYKQECDIDDIATHLGRTRDGCIKRLTRLGVYEGLRNSPRDRMRRMLDWDKLSKEESASSKNCLCLLCGNLTLEFSLTSCIYPFLLKKFLN